MEGAPSCCCYNLLLVVSAWLPACKHQQLDPPLPLHFTLTHCPQHAGLDFSPTAAPLTACTTIPRIPYMHREDETAPSPFPSHAHPLRGVSRHAVIEVRQVVVSRDIVEAV